MIKATETNIQLNNWYKCSCYITKIESDPHNRNTSDLLTLTILGMYDISSGGSSRIVPWSKLRSHIKHIIIENKITFDEKHSNLHHLFTNCSRLKTMEGLNNLDTSNVKDMFSMFSGCSSLTELNISNFDVKNVFRLSECLTIAAV